MLQASSNHSDIKKCVLKCKDATDFFDFPSEDIFRNLWLYKLGLEQYDHRYSVCDRHFSENMLTSVGKKLIDLAVPDINLPDTLIKRKVIYDRLIKKIIPTKTPEKGKQIAAPKIDFPILMANMQKAALTKSIPDVNASLTNIPASYLSKTNIPTDSPKGDFTSVKDWLNDSSTLLMDYQLRFQGRHMCDVIEIPEHIVVFTAFKAKELKTGPQNVFVQNKSKENLNPLSSIPSPIAFPQTISKIKSPSIETIPIDANQDIKGNRTIALTDFKPEVDYVYYMNGEAIPRREREVQVDFPKISKESAIQCDIEFDSSMLTLKSNLDGLDCSSPATQVNMHECLKCGEILANNASRVRHAFVHEKIHSLCPHCGKVFSNKLKLNTHERKVHSENDLEIKKALRCPKLHCNKAFHSKKQLNNHIDGHSSKAVHKCSKCLRLFSSSLKLFCHQKTFKNCVKSRWSKTRKCSKRK